MQRKTYIRQGTGTENAVIFIHGILGTPEHFAPLLPLVPNSWTICNLCLDGHGGSAKAFSGTSMLRWKQQVREAVDTLVVRHTRIIIVAHSMGTLFAIEEAIRLPEYINALFLLAVPLKIFVKPMAVRNSICVLFNCIPANDSAVLAARSCCGVEPSRCLLDYAGWPMRYMELFTEIRSVRKKLDQLRVPSWVFQSGRDELVPRCAMKQLQRNPNIVCGLLPASYHFCYDAFDFGNVLTDFRAVLEQIETAQNKTISVEK